MTRLAVEIVLAGGVFRATDEAFYERLHGRVRAVVPRATFVRLDAPPVAGPALEGLDRIGAGGPEVRERLLAELAAVR
jgi:hypothetical protein